MVVGLLLIIFAVINSIGLLKQNKFLIFKIINYWTFPIIYTICYCCVIFANISIYLYGMIILLIEKIIYLFYWRRSKNSIGEVNNS